MGNDRVEVSDLFADGVILFLSHYNRSTFNVLNLVLVFELISGLRINMEKCGLVGINMSDSKVNNLADAIGCVTLAWPITYLGILLGSNPRCKSFWKEVVRYLSA